MCHAYRQGSESEKKRWDGQVCSGDSGERRPEEPLGKAESRRSRGEPKRSGEDMDQVGALRREGGFSQTSAPCSMSSAQTGRKKERTNDIAGVVVRPRFTRNER